MISQRLKRRNIKQILNVFRTRFGRFSDTVCNHDPNEIMVFVTNRCNFLCNTCPITHESPWSPPPGIPDMNLELFEEVLQNHRGASMVGLVGGEPLLHPDIEEMIQIAASKKMTVNMSTNGSLLNEDRIASILKQPLNYINISLDAVDETEFRRLRGGSAEMYNKVKQNIKRLSSERKRTGSFVNIYLSFVTDRVNVRRIPEFMELGATLGADTVFCQSVLSYQCSNVTTGEEVLWDTPENQQIVSNIPERSDIQIVPPVLIPFDEHEGCQCVRCIHPFKLLALDGAGNLSPCCVIPPHPRFGNIRKQPDAWRHGSIMKNFRQEMLTDQDASEEICVQCWERYSLKE